MSKFHLIGETLDYKSFLSTGDFKITYGDIDAYIGEITNQLDIYIRKGNFNGYVGYINKKEEIVLKVNDFEGVVGYIDNDLKIYMNETGIKILFK